MSHAQIKQAMQDKGINPHDVIWEHTKHTYNRTAEIIWKWIVVAVGIYGVYSAFVHYGGVSW